MATTALKVGKTILKFREGCSVKTRAVAKAAAGSERQNERLHHAGSDQLRQWKSGNNSDCTCGRICGRDGHRQGAFV